MASYQTFVTIQHEPVVLYDNEAPLFKSESDDSVQIASGEKQLNGGETVRFSLWGEGDYLFFDISVAASDLKPEVTTENFAEHLHSLGVVVDVPNGWTVSEKALCIHDTYTLQCSHKE